MKRSFGFVAVIIISVILLCASAYGRDPIKWSAPMNEYPTSWYPTTPPPSYYNPGYSYPYAGYGYGGYYGGQYQGAYQQPQQRGFSGNPYNYNYYYGQ